MTQIVKLWSQPEVSVEQTDPEWPSHCQRPSPSGLAEPAPGEEVPIHLAPPPCPWPRIFPGW